MSQVSCHTSGQSAATTGQFSPRSGFHLTACFRVVAAPGSSPLRWQWKAASDVPGRQRNRGGIGVAQPLLGNSVAPALHREVMPTKKDSRRIVVSPLIASSREGIRTLTGNTPHGILSPVRLPVPPLGRVGAGCWAGTGDGFRRSWCLHTRRPVGRSTTDTGGGYGSLWFLPPIKETMRLIAFRNALALASTLSVDTPRPR